MKTLKVLTAIAAICVAFTYTSCTSGRGSAFKTHEDSLAFAKNYFNKYPDENSVVTRFSSDDTTIMKGIQPITWATVTKYSGKYDVKPLIYNSAGEALKGYMVDSTGFSMILANKEIKGVYLRLGRKDDGAVTIMLLGLDGKNHLIKDSTGGYNGDVNFDNTLACPKICPED
jgi:hypothetical protein